MTKLKETNEYQLERLRKSVAKQWAEWWAENTRDCHYCTETIGRTAYVISYRGELEAPLGVYCSAACARNQYKDRPAMQPLKVKK